MFHIFQAGLVATSLTFVCGCFMHLVLRSGRQSFRSGSFLQYQILLMLYCLGPAVGSAWWQTLNSLIRVLYPSFFFTLLACLCVTYLCVKFYGMHGPEPMMPSNREDLHPRSLSSVRRSVTSLLVYASVLCVVQAWNTVLKRIVVFFAS